MRAVAKLFWVLLVVMMAGTWPASAQLFSLQTTTNLANPDSWAKVADTPAIVGLQCLVTNQISGGGRFYRLSK